MLVLLMIPIYMFINKIIIYQTPTDPTTYTTHSSTPVLTNSTSEASTATTQPSTTQTESTTTRQFTLFENSNFGAVLILVVIIAILLILLFLLLICIGIFFLRKQDYKVKARALTLRGVILVEIMSAVSLNC